jgi:RNA polymerase sigma-70 factor, ECF subfamily
VLSEEMALDSALARVAQGDPRAFVHVHELTRVHLLSVALRIVRQRELAEDVLQDVYVAVWQRAGQYDPAIARPMTWLITMVRHRAIDLLRSRRKGDSAEPGEAVHEPTEAAWADDSAHPLERRFDAARIGACLPRLSPPHRQSLALAYYHGLTHSQVAERLGAPIGSVKSWIRRGLDQLRQCIEAGATP